MFRYILNVQQWIFNLAIIPEKLMFSDFAIEGVKNKLEMSAQATLNYSVLLWFGKETQKKEKIKLLNMRGVF